MATTPYLGIDNLVTTESPTVTVSTEDSAYPASNLTDYEDATHVFHTTDDDAETINLLFSGAVSVDLCVIDRRNNFAVGTTVKLYKGDYPGSAVQQGSTFTTAALGQAIVIALDEPVSDAEWTLLIDDPGGGPGYLEIAYLYLGVRAELTNSFGEWNEATVYAVQEVESDMGGVRRLKTSGKHYEYQLPYDMIAADMTTLRAVRDYAVDRPFVYALGGSHTPPDGVYVFQWMDPARWNARAKTVTGGVKSAEITFRELPGGIGQ